MVKYYYIFLEQLYILFAMYALSHISADTHFIIGAFHIVTMKH